MNKIDKINKNDDSNYYEDIDYWYVVDEDEIVFYYNEITDLPENENIECCNEFWKVVEK